MLQVVKTMGDPLPGLQMVFLVNSTAPPQPYHQGTLQPGFPPPLKALTLPAPWNLPTNHPPAPKPFASGSLLGMLRFPGIQVHGLLESY